MTAGNGPFPEGRQSRPLSLTEPTVTTMVSGTVGDRAAAECEADPKPTATVRKSQSRLPIRSIELDGGLNA
jgi:hypothetical protein